MPATTNDSNTFELSEQEHKIYYDAIEHIAYFQEEREQIMAEAKRACDELKEECNRIAEQALSSLDGLAQRGLASALYWRFEELIRAETISRGANLSSGRNVCNWVFRLLRESTCPQCGKTLYSTKQSRSGGYSPFRCDECDKKRVQQWERQRREQEAELKKLRSMPYPEYLQTEHWKEVRRRALKRSGFRCQICNTNKKALHVHHRTYANRGQEYSSDVIVLCEECHRTFHDNGQLASTITTIKSTAIASEGGTGK